MTKNLKTKVNYLSNFPKGFEPRKSQKEAFKGIEEIFKSGKKFAIVCAPTGSGKSHIATTIARSAKAPSTTQDSLIRSYGIYERDAIGNYVNDKAYAKDGAFGAFILTSTKALQDQYKALFNESVVIKGKNNYQCKVDLDCTVDSAPCLTTPKLKKECFCEDKCPYYKARNAGLVSLDPILNYKAFFGFPDFLQRRQVIICDEAGHLEDELVGANTISILYSFLEEEGIEYNKLLKDDTREALFWCQDIYSQLDELVKDTISRLRLFNSKDDMGSSLKRKALQKLSKLQRLKDTLGTAIDNWEKCQYMIEERDKDLVTFIPYNIKPLAKALFDKADQIILMSATISNPKVYAASLGIKPEEYGFMEVPSTFSAKKSPIMASSQCKLNYYNMEKDLPKVLEMALAVCDKHKKDKGLIHTHSFKITQALQKAVRGDSRFLFRESGRTNEDILFEHKNAKYPTILVSPSMDTGISLDDDLGRFQIIMKAPYLPLGSKRIKKILEEYPDQYMMKMLDTLIQMSGRCTRSMEDYSETYILDGVATSAILREKRSLPKSFLERFV